ncbi:MAG: hypothetical protein Q8Q62_21280 [Mesorhizobium sp.]|nr:hypothetical protein [Mesorhizobium sp.]
MSSDTVQEMTMKIVLALAASMSLLASAALAECGHDKTAQSTSTVIATLDMATTASTVAIPAPVDQTVEPELPAEAE